MMTFKNNKTNLFEEDFFNEEDFFEEEIEGLCPSISSIIEEDNQYDRKLFNGNVE